jgi:hypothetical protein
VSSHSLRPCWDPVLRDGSGPPVDPDVLDGNPSPARLPGHLGARPRFGRTGWVPEPGSGSGPVHAACASRDFALDARLLARYRVDGLSAQKGYGDRLPLHSGPSRPRSYLL